MTSPLDCFAPHHQPAPPCPARPHKGLTQLLFSASEMYIYVNIYMSSFLHNDEYRTAVDFFFFSQLQFSPFFFFFF